MSDGETMHDPTPALSAASQLERGSAAQRLRGRAAHARAACFALLCGVALGCGDGAAPKTGAPAQEPPRVSPAPHQDAPSSGAASAQPTEVPRDQAGGQSGSIGTTMPCLPLRTVAVSADDQALRGYTLASLDDWLSDVYAEPMTLFWYVGERVPASIELSFAFAGEAMLEQYSLAGETVADERCSFDDTLVQRGTLRVHTSDGLLDAEVETVFEILGPDAVRGPQIALQNLIPIETLGAPLAAAISEALSAVGATQPYAGIRVEATPNQRDNTSWDVKLSLVPADAASDLLNLAHGVTDLALPAARVPFAPRAELATECERAANAPAPVLPAAWVPFGAVAGTWLLCSGDYPASVSVEHAGIRIDLDGSYRVLDFEAGQLVERSGFGQQGELERWGPNRFAELIGDSALSPGAPVMSYVPAPASSTDLLLSDSGARGGLRGFRGQFELADDGRSLRVGPHEASIDPLSLVYVRTELAVQPATAPAWNTGEAAGVAGCDALEQSLRPALAEDAARVAGTFAFCAGGLRGAARLTLATDGHFDEHDGTGALVRQGTYAIVTDPGAVYASDSLADLMLTDDSGARDLLGLVAVSEQPYKLLARWYRPEDASWDVDRYVVLSPEP